MTVADSVTKKSNLALRTVHVNGSLGSIQRITDVSAGRDTGVPQMVANEAGLMLAWTDIAPQHGLRTALVSWGSLVSSATLKPMLFAQNTPLFIPIICGQPH